MNTTGQIRITDEVIHCDDGRFPPNNKLVGPPPTDAFIESMVEIQLQQVGLATNDLEGKKLLFRFVWGTRRIKAIRFLHSEGRHDGMVRTAVIHGVDLNDVATLSLMENSCRTPNEMSAFLMLDQLLHKAMKDHTDLMDAYRNVAKLTGYTVGTIKKIEKDWADTPKWAVKAAEEGKIAVTNAKKIGGLGKENQDQCLTYFKENKELPGSVIDGFKKFTQQQNYTPVAQVLFAPQPRQYYPRTALEALLVRYQEGWGLEVIMDEVRNLLAQTE